MANVVNHLRNDDHIALVDVDLDCTVDRTAFLFDMSDLIATAPRLSAPLAGSTRVYSTSQASEAIATNDDISWAFVPKRGWSCSGGYKAVCGTDGTCVGKRIPA